MEGLSKRAEHFSDSEWFVVYLNRADNPSGLLHFLLSPKPSEGSRSWHIWSLLWTIWPVKTPQKSASFISLSRCTFQSETKRKRNKMSNLQVYHKGDSWAPGGVGACITPLLPITHLTDLTPVQSSRLPELCYFNVLLGSLHYYSAWLHRRIRLGVQ